MKYRPVIATRSSVQPGDQTGQAGFTGWCLTSNLFVLSMAILLAVIVPQTVHAVMTASRGVYAAADPRLLMVIFPIVAGDLSLRRMGLVPFISERQLIMPTFLTTFGAAIASSFILVIPLARQMLMLALVITLAWYLTVSLLRGRLLRPKIGLIGVTADGLEDFPQNVQWRVIAPPNLPDDITAVVVDPHAELDVAHSHLITELVLAGIPVYHRGHFEEGLTGRVRFSHHADNNFGALLPSFTYLRFKRAFDLVGALLLAPFFAALIFIAAVLIKLDTPGPAFFFQRRRGYRGETFTCYKLRTMRTGEDGPEFTLHGDQRITPLGRFLRKWRIDELPQIVNIMRGEMSWIGPRPEALALAERYADHVPFYDYRHAVRPGISGWAAVLQGNVGDVEAARKKLEYDFFYIKYFSFWLDFLIVLKTIQTMWNGFGAR